MSVALQIESNLAELGPKLERYAQLRKMTIVEAVQKNAKEFTFFLADELKKKSPTRGSIKSGALAWLKGRTKGVKVRPTIQFAVAAKYQARQDITTRRFQLQKRGKGSVLKGKGENKRRLNLQALMVERELNIRERGIGFMQFAARQKGLQMVDPGSSASWFAKFGQKVSEAKMSLVANFAGDSIAKMEIIYGGGETKFGEALQKPFGEVAIAAALQRTSDNLQTYLDRKEREAAEALE